MNFCLSRLILFLYKGAFFLLRPSSQLGVFKAFFYIDFLRHYCPSRMIHYLCYQVYFQRNFNKNEFFLFEI